MPLLDAFVIAPLFSLEASIHVLNAVASLAKAGYLWTINQQSTSKLVDKRTEKELEATLNYTLQALSAVVALNFNFALSFISLLTRPIASLVYAATEGALLADECARLRNEAYCQLAY